MGRIAEALKKAERERLAHSGGATAVGLTTPPPTTEESAPAAPEGTEALEAPVAFVPVKPLSESVVAYHEPSSPITEQYRTLRTRLLSHNPYNEHGILAVTSSAPKEGKTITAVNLAFTFAEIRHFNILLVDADFRRSSLAGILNLPSAPGLAELLAGEVGHRDVTQKTPVPNLHFVPSGELKGRSPPELLSAISTRSVFRGFESQYHFTFVDTPPATTVTDAGIIGQLCSGVIMVIRMHKTPEPLAKRAVRLLQVNSIPILGSVLIGRDERSAGYGYRYYRYYRDYVKQDRD